MMMEDDLTSSPQQSKKTASLDGVMTAPSTPPLTTSRRRSLKFNDSPAAASAPPSVTAAAAPPRQQQIPVSKSAVSMGGISSSAHASSVSGVAPSSFSSANKRLYRASGGSSIPDGTRSKYVTRDIAALEFLLGIPLAAEASLVQTGWRLQQQQYEEDREDHDYSEAEYVSDAHHATTARKHASVAAAAAAAATTSRGTWWEKYVRSFNDHFDVLSHTKSKQQQQQEEGGELERPTTSSSTITKATRTASGMLIPAYTPGRRLDGDEAIHIQIPLTTDGTITRQKSIARIAALREWERKTAHGISQQQQQQTKMGAANTTMILPKHPPLLDGRLFLSASGSYPISVFSMIRYEPKREQAEQFRKKLESLGGGGSQFIMPTRDWRGISYRVLLPRKHERSSSRAFNRFLRPPGLLLSTSSAAGLPSSDADKDRKLGAATSGQQANNGDENDVDDSESTSSESSEDSDVYVPGLLDDPEMTHGRHHNVMIGDLVTGPIVSSTIQFVKPAILKAELNKQFRDRFDGWEPPKSARKYIGAFVSVPEGKYVLNDPTTTTDDNAEYPTRATRTRQGSTASLSSASEGGHKDKTSTLRIPPSLTLSKIRSLKHQALQAAIKAKLEVGTVALACVYFERLCFDCRVDKSNRRLAFAACLLLATKINEPNVRLVMRQEVGENNKEKSRFQSLARVTKGSTKAFASLLEFFTEAWSLTVKSISDAEWGVFAALGFSLHATPSQVAFHYRRLMKTLEWNPRDYLGKEMWEQWQDALKEEERRKRERERRREIERKKKEEKLLDLQLELEHEVLRRQTGDKSVDEVPPSEEARQSNQQSVVPANKGRKSVGIKLFNPFGMRRSHSAERLGRLVSASDHPGDSHQRTATPISGFPSMPVLPHHDDGIAGVVSIEIPEDVGSETSSIGVVEGSEDGLIV